MEKRNEIPNMASSVIYYIASVARFWSRAAIVACTFMFALCLIMAALLRKAVAR